MSDSPRYYFKELRLQQFRSIVALARWQTFSAAAEALRLTRASVWQQVRSLEQELACTLVRTRGHRVELTPAGHKLVEIVAPLVAGFDSVKAALQASIQKDLPQTLVIAAAPSFLIFELREPIARIHEEHPQLHLTFLERNSPASIELLDQGGADLAIAAKPEGVEGRRSLEYTPLSVYPFTLICPVGHPLLKKRSLSLSDLTRYPLIMPSTVTYCRQQFDAVMSSAKLLEKVNMVIESNFPIMLFEYVRLGLGVAITPLPPGSEARWPQPNVGIRNISHLLGDEPIYYVRRRGQFETPYAARFRALATADRAKAD
jgi:DNA-binding transcriptional LysR family regulator